MHPYPAYVEKATGTRLQDADGNELLDLIFNATSLIHGHVHPAVTEAIRDQAGRSTAVLAPNAAQIALAEQMCSRVASLQRLRFTNSGTEATMMMVKTARAFTGRDLVLKMDGAYHGTFDGMELNAATPGSAQAVPYTGGVPANLGDNVIIGRFNDTAGVTALIERYADRLAAVIVTPMASVATWIPPEPGFLEGLRAATTQRDVLLLFDEVIAFRVALGGAQQRYGVTPDLTAYGKVIGGGLPVGAYGGRADVMAVTDPAGGPRVAHAGTFNGNPVTAAAGLATLRLLDADAYARLEQLGERFAAALRAAFTDLALPLGVRQVGSLVSVAVTDRTPALWDEVNATMRLALLNRGVCGWGVFALPTVFDEAEIDEAVSAIHDALREPAAALAGLEVPVG
ncbi:aspartate aminotransferase family protein [Micromonospora sp. NBC_01813]|uniref:aspartate aminotransferase family protein n=1 Tax=Micromonospora sp. NBC_01813 TaxID=2975988 RepID=UPI002DD86E9F|nr:aminotransferase class III-fold pyridoxal phosphate-dependent enzyme [Micromonospora sp. NBC_01813]WSA10051.1 aminotransferase class III-fold pyridoxal phosphate-dependent enzyme [Micromonospora sp. NBC_01813]